jgi:hypothetical protein
VERWGDYSVAVCALDDFYVRREAADRFKVFGDDEEVLARFGFLAARGGANGDWQGAVLGFPFCEVVCAGLIFVVVYVNG